MTLNFAACSLAFVTSAACSVLFFRAYSRTGARLLLWSGMCFACLTLNNALLFTNFVLVPEIDLRLYRFASSAAGLVFLLYGLIWEGEAR